MQIVSYTPQSIAVLLIFLYKSIIYPFCLCLQNRKSKIVNQFYIPASIFDCAAYCCTIGSLGFSCADFEKYLYASAGLPSVP